MSSENLPAIGNQSFESLKQITPHGAEYWSARDLQPLLGYNHWRSFEKAITKAINSCEQSGNEPDHHFARARKMIAVGKGGQREVLDFQLSRFACYLIAQNGDPRKPEIALAQKYFAIQTRRQELSDQQAADLERLELRKQASEEFKMLARKSAPRFNASAAHCQKTFPPPSTSNKSRSECRARRPSWCSMTPTHADYRRYRAVLARRQNRTYRPLNR